MYDSRLWQWNPDTQKILQIACILMCINLILDSVLYTPLFTHGAQRRRVGIAVLCSADRESWGCPGMRAGSPSGGGWGKPASVLISTSCVMLKFDVLQNIIDACEERTASFLSLTLITNGKLALLYLVFNRVEVLGHLFWFALVACVALRGGRRRCSALPQFFLSRKFLCLSFPIETGQLFLCYVLSVSVCSLSKAGYFFFCLLIQAVECDQE